MIKSNHKPWFDEVEGKFQLCTTGNLEDIYHFIAICPTSAVYGKNWFQQTNLVVQNLIACYGKRQYCTVYQRSYVL